MPYVFAPPPIPSLPVMGAQARFPLRRVFCVGRNYADHAREMGADPDREPPFFFLKPADAVVLAAGEVPYPPMTANLHHEIELVVAIGRGGREIPVAAAHEHLWGYGVGVDLTRRDLQDQAKAQRRPWEWGKAFDASAPCSPLVPFEVAGHLQHGRIWLSVEDQLRQEGDLTAMIWSVPEIVAAISRSVALAPGDLILTGTPAGVGPVAPGQMVRGGIAGVGEICFRLGSGGDPANAEA